MNDEIVVYVPPEDESGAGLANSQPDRRGGRKTGSEGDVGAARESKEKEDNPEDESKMTPEKMAHMVAVLKLRIEEAQGQMDYFEDEGARHILIREIESIIVELGEIEAMSFAYGEVARIEKKNKEYLKWIAVKASAKGVSGRADSYARMIREALPYIPPEPPIQSSYGELDSPFDTGGVGSGSGDGEPPKDSHEHHYPNHEYPNMGDYDYTKRFLLAPEIGGDWWDYEEVKDWGYGQIIQAIYLYIEMFLSRDWHLDRPFISQNLLAKHANITPDGKDGMQLSLKEAITELGGDVTQVILDRVGALEGLTKRATDHQPLRILGHNAAEVVQSVAFDNSIIEGLFDTHTTGPDGELVELRARGMPVTNAVLLRFVFASMYNRGLNEDGDERKDKPSPFEQEGGERPKYIKSFEQLTKAMMGLLKYIRSKSEGGADFREDPAMEYYLKGVPYSENWAQENEEFVDDQVLERIVKAAVGKAVNFGDASLVRAIHDLGGSRHDELDVARLLRFRASQEKYYIYDENGEYKRRKGSVEITDVAIISFWESLYKPALQRIRMRPISVNIDMVAYQKAINEWDEAGQITDEPQKEDFFRVASEEKQWHNAMTDWDIPSISLLDKDQLKAVRGILQQTEKIKDKIFLVERGLNDNGLDSLNKQIAVLNKQMTVLSRQLIVILTEAGLLDQIPDGGNLVLTSLYDLIKKHHEKSVEDEMKKINHVGPVRKALSDFDFDIGSLVVKREREFAGGEAITFNPQLADNLSSVLRSAFYYWIEDYRKKELSAREYHEMTQNYAEPRKEDYVDATIYDRAIQQWEEDHAKPRIEDFPGKYMDYRRAVRLWKRTDHPDKPQKEDSVDTEAYNVALEEWQRKWAWRGIPLRMYKRVSPEDSTPLLDKNGKPITTYVEYDINHLFNLHVDLDKLVKQKRLTKEEAAWHQQDFMRIIGAEDQLDEMMKICTEKLVMMKIKSFVKSGSQWTRDHTYALVQLMSSEAFTEDREGFRNLILRQKTGMFGFFPGVDETYAGSGGWTRDEVVNLIKASVGSFKAHGFEIGDDKK